MNIHMVKREHLSAVISILNVELLSFTDDCNLSPVHHHQPITIY